jgi:hypothetical protein
MTDTNSSLATLDPFVSHRAFTLWRWEQAGDKRLKVPVHYDGRTRHSTERPAPPLTAAEARAWQAHHADPAIGIGFRPSGTGLVCIDLDSCIVDGQWSAGAQAVMARFPGALIEQSVSGRGAHIWVHAPGAPVGRRGQVSTPHGKLEMYADGQFLAAGRVLGGQVLDHTAAVVAMLEEFWPPMADAGPAPQVQAWAERPFAERAAVMADVGAALAYLDPDNRDEWVSAGQALRSMGEDGYALWAAWSARSSRFPGGDGLEKWDTFSGERSDYRAILAKAQRLGWSNPASRPDVTAQDPAALFATGGPTFGTGPTPAGMLTEPPPSRVAPASELSFAGAASGFIPATLAKVTETLLSPEAGVLLRYDVFKDDQYISIGGEPWRPVTDNDVIDLRIRFERRGFKPVASECMNDAIKVVAKLNQVDSARDWVEGLTWDGVTRIDRLMPDYYGTEDTPYTRSIGAYLFTALAGRSLCPGVKADMMVILVGVQGAAKTTSVEVLAPDPANFGEIDLSKKDADLARSLRGKQVMELAELQGLSGRALEATKAWLSRRVEKWVPKFEEREIAYPRRMIPIGTTNEDEFLDDPTGERRMLPARVGVMRIDKLRRDAAQLWAEGAARYRVGGVEWQQAQELAKAEHAQYKVHDDWRERIVAWLESPPVPLLGQPVDPDPRGSKPLVLADVLTGAINMPTAQINYAASKRAAKIMRSLGYRPKALWIDGAAVRKWIR